MDEREQRQGSIPIQSQERRSADSLRLRHALWALITRRVPREHAFSLSHRALAPRAGDLVLAKLEMLGMQRGLQSCQGRARQMNPGDEIVVAYGNRHAPGQFEAVVPKTLGPCQLVAAGGVAGKIHSWHTRIGSGPTLINPVGLLLRPDGARANLADYALEPAAALPETGATTIAVIGSSARVGKTTAAAALARGLSGAGLRVGYAKVTGTGAGEEAWLLHDAGARVVLDFLDAGHPSTYRLPLPELERILVTLIAHLARAGADAIVLELADGLLQEQTAALLGSPVFRKASNAVFFAAGDAMSAAAGTKRLAQRGLPVVGLGGVLTASPLQCTEARIATDVTTYSQADLSQASVARSILTKARRIGKTSGVDDACTDGNRDDSEFSAQA